MTAGDSPRPLGGAARGRARRRRPRPGDRRAPRPRVTSSWWRSAAALLVAGGAPGRRELRERLLRRGAWRGHPRAARTRPAHPAGAAHARGPSWRRRCSRSGVAAVAGLALALATAGADPGGGRAGAGRCAPVLGRPAALRRHSASASSWCSCSSGSWRPAAPLRDGGDHARGRLVVARRSSASWRWRSWWPTTSATSPPMTASGKRTLAVRLGDAQRGASTGLRDRQRSPRSPRRGGVHRVTRARDSRSGRCSGCSPGSGDQPMERGLGHRAAI